MRRIISTFRKDGTDPRDNRLGKIYLDLTVSFGYIIFFLSLFTTLSCSAQKGKVILIKDGDTVVILDDLKKKHTIRIADVDCPEMGQSFGKKAKLFSSDQICGKKVTVISKGVDRYGRTIGFVMYDNGKNLSRELLLNGYAWHYVKYSNSITFPYLEMNAKINKLGLWSEKNAIAPWDWRRY